jgi:hypothetical protein
MGLFFYNALLTNPSCGLRVASSKAAKKWCITSKIPYFFNSFESVLEKLATCNW